MRHWIAVVAGIALALAVASAGWGHTLPGSLRITGPSNVRRGASATVSVSASTPVGLRMAIYFARFSCGRRLQGTLDHESSEQVLQRWVARSFAGRIRLPRAQRGTHHVCGYLYHRVYDNLITDVHASFTFVAR